MAVDWVVGWLRAMSQGELIPPFCVELVLRDNARYYLKEVDAVPARIRKLVLRNLLKHMPGAYRKSVRHDVDSFFSAFPEYANSLFDGRSASQVANGAITSVVNAHLSIASMQSHIAEDALRQCALGNRAACD